MPAASPRIHAPEFSPGDWLNTPRPLRLANQRGRAMLVHIWDFTCLNCLRTLPHLTAWHQASRDWPVTFVGIHTPEFDFAKDRRQVEAAVRRQGIEYPVLLDNRYQTWDAFANRYWPTVYLIDTDGYIRYQHSGEGAYAETEGRLRELALEAAQRTGQPELGPLPGRLDTLRQDDEIGAACAPGTPELHAGYQQGALGNPEGYLPRSLPLIYKLPPGPQRQDGFFYAAGAWRAGDDFFALAGALGALVLPYHAASAHAVLAASADPVELMLDLKPPARLRVTQDGAPLDSLSAGADVTLEAGQSYLTVDTPRLYEIARNPDSGAHELRLDVLAGGVALFAFSFTACRM
jgi:thiol-disulfide isomerase/thioredoxin